MFAQFTPDYGRARVVPHLPAPTKTTIEDWGADSHGRHRRDSHLPPRTPGSNTDLADPAGFVLAGSLADIIGRRLDDIDPSWLESLQQNYPRHHLKQKLIEALRAEAKAVPRGRMHLANRWGSLPLLVRTAPYRE